MHSTAQHSAHKRQEHKHINESRADEREEQRERREYAKCKITSTLQLGAREGLAAGAKKGSKAAMRSALVAHSKSKGARRSALVAHSTSRPHALHMRKEILREELHQAALASPACRPTADLPTIVWQRSRSPASAPPLFSRRRHYFPVAAMLRQFSAEIMSLVYPRKQAAIARGPAAEHAKGSQRPQLRTA
jgi:hypothetical protein